MSESEAAGGITPTFIKFQVEKLRLICYLSFWGMCLFAMFVSSNTVAKTLGPCSLNEGDEPTYGMHCSVLMEVFGFNNVSITSVWFYLSSRLSFSVRTKLIYLYTAPNRSVYSGIILQHARQQPWFIPSSSTVFHFTSSSTIFK